MRILLLGSGGREHALAWKIAQSSLLDALFIAPGNAGTSSCGIHLPLKISNFRAVKEAVIEHRINFIVVGSEELLANGIHDFFLHDPQVAHVKVIGPQQVGAQLESSKDFAKQFMARHQIPTARYGTFTEHQFNEACLFLDNLSPPYVLKADGLASGKGVLILDSLQEAKAELTNMLSGEKFGKAGTCVVIEEFLDGQEFSVFILTDGKSYKLLPEAKDYKRIGDGDTGLNTGGMGAISPVPFVDNYFMQLVEHQIIIPTIEGLIKDNIPYTGFLFFGLIKVGDSPFVIEYNCRLGDPETQVILPRLKSDLLDLFDGLASSTLSERDVVFDSRCAATVIMASGGYPETFQKGKRIEGLDAPSPSLIFHAGTKSTNQLVHTAGGRVLAITSYGQSLPTAVHTSYNTIHNIHFDQAYYRKDIGKDVF